MENITWIQLGAFWVNVVLAVIIVTATLINYLFFRSQTDPEVIIYATPDTDRNTIILLVIENIGKNIALDVQFSADRKIPEHAFGFENAPIPEEMKRGPIITGVPALGPSAKRIITWGQYGGLLRGLGSDFITFKVKYKSQKHILPGYKNYVRECRVDIKSFEGTDVSDTNWEKKSADALEKIAMALEKKAT